MKIADSINKYLKEKLILGLLSKSTIESRYYQLSSFKKFCNQFDIEYTFEIKRIR